MNQPARPARFLFDSEIEEIVMRSPEGQKALGMGIGSAILGQAFADLKKLKTRRRVGMGRRFVWDLPDSVVDGWASDLDQDVRKGMRAIAVALRDYGGIGMDHAGNGAMWAEHDHSARWGDIGFTRGRTWNALHGLLAANKHRARCIEPPTFPGGDMNNPACYPGVAYPEGHTCRR